MALDHGGLRGWGRRDELSHDVGKLFIHFHLLVLHFHHHLEGVGGGRCSGGQNHGCAFIFGHNGGLTTDG